MIKEEIFIKLSHFLVPEDSSELPESILNFLIKQSLVSKGSIQCSDIQNLIKQEFDLEFENQELERAIKSLAEDKQIIKKRSELLLAENIRRELNEKLEQSRQREVNFYEIVRGKFLGFNPTLSPAEIDALQEDFSLYLNGLFIKLGAESLRFLYPESKQLTKTIESIKTDVISILPKRDIRLDSIRKQYFSTLLRELSETQRDYLSNKLTSVFLYTLVSIDPKCSAYLQKTLKGYQLYLDTNFIYDLLGLHDKEYAQSAKRLVDIVKKFNFKLFATTKTLEEFNASLKNAEKFLRYHPLPTKDLELLRVAADSLEEAFIKSYWRQYANENIGLEEFLSFYRNAKGILGGFGIKITNILANLIKKDEKELKAIGKDLQRFAGKNDIVAEHDAFHILLVRKIREDNQSSGSNEVKYWFLTNDRSLLRYELSLEKRRRAYYPACILPEHLLQILRPLLPRSIDYEQSLLSFVAGHHQAGFELPATLAFDILERLDRYKSKPKEIAIKILTNAHFSHKLKTIKEKEKREEAIDNELLRYAKQAIDEKEKVLQQSKKLGDLRYKLQKENEDLKKFKEEIESGRIKRTNALRWFGFICLEIIESVLIIFVVYKLIKLLNLQGFSGVIICVLSFVIWCMCLLISLRILPDNHSKSLTEDLKFLLSIGPKYFGGGKEK